MTPLSPRRYAACLLVLILSPVALLNAQDEKVESPEIRLGEGRVVMQAPADWKSKTPSSRIVEYEFSAESKEGEDVRITFMAAGGGVEANVERWKGQFEQPDGKSTDDRTEVKKSEQSGYQLHIVDIVGTYKDRPGGPFAGGAEIKRPMYRMLGGILVTEKSGQYYVKMYGPAASVEANAEAFKKMVSSAKVK